MPMIGAAVANCPYDDVANVLCCACCGGCDNHEHVNCDSSAFCMIAPANATCAGCGRHGVRVCATCGYCGAHNHSH
jgi:hypothetical protein